MKSAIFSLLPVKPRSTIASVRIGQWLSKTLDIPIYDDAELMPEKVEKLFIINGSTLYCNCLPEIAKRVAVADQVIWVQNDYTLPPPKDISAAESPFRKAFADRKLVPHYWTTVKENSGKTLKSGWVNWNTLGFRKDVPQAKLLWEGVIYYGAYRQDREACFNRMYDIFSDQKLSISSTSRKFPDELLVAPFREDLYDSLSEYSLGIYGQDKKSAPKEHCPATRFYEMLSVGLPMVFMPDCFETMWRHGYSVNPYVVKDKATAQELMDTRRGIQDTQKSWIRDFESELTTQVKELYDLL